MKNSVVNVNKVCVLSHCALYDVAFMSTRHVSMGVTHKNACMKVVMHEWTKIIFLVLQNSIFNLTTFSQ